MSGDGTGNYSSESGASNTVLGLGSLAACTTGVGNTAVGVAALTAVGGGGNTGVGYGALSGTNALVNKVTAVGPGAGTAVRGCEHTLVGAVGRVNAVVNSTVVGRAQSTGGAVGADNTILLGSPVVTTALVCPLRKYNPVNGDSTLDGLPDGAVFEQDQEVNFYWDSPFQNVPQRRTSVLKQVFVKLPLPVPVTLTYTRSFGTYIESVTFQKLLSLTATHSSLSISLSSFEMSGVGISVPLPAQVEYQFVMIQGEYADFSISRRNPVLSNTYPAVLTGYSVASVPRFVKVDGLWYQQAALKLSAFVNVGQKYTVLLASRAVSSGAAGQVVTDVRFLTVTVNERTAPVVVAPPVGPTLPPNWDESEFEKL